MAISLAFTPLINGVNALNRMPIDLKALMRIWSAPQFWRITNIYIPYILSDVLTGLRASSTWAVGAVLIGEGMVNGVSGDSVTLGHALISPFSANAPGKTPVVITVAILIGFYVYRLSGTFQSFIERKVYGKSSEQNSAYTLYCQPK